MNDRRDRSVILIVDDNPINLFAKRRLLGQQGYEMHEALTGQEALTIVRSVLPDLVLLDVNLPDISGLEVCHQLKNHPETQFIKVIHTSSISIRESDRTGGLTIGADAYLIEPTETEELFGTIKVVLALAHHERENRRLIERLAESEARFHTIAEAVPSFLFETDVTGWNTWASKGWCRFTGQTPEHVSGLGWADALHPEDRADTLDRWRHCMQNGVPFESTQRLRQADDTYAWVIVRALPVQDNHGTITRWICSVMDVDATVRAEEEQARLAAIVGSTSDAIISENLQGIITSWNKGAEVLLGYTACEIIGRPAILLFPPDRRGEEPINAFGTIETMHRCKDGRDICVSLTLSPIRNRQGDRLGTSQILREITGPK